MLTCILLIFGFIILIKGADFLVEAASSIAMRLKVSNLVIGLTAVAFGTSSPELFVNIIASIKGNTDIAIGNIVGSNIANVFLILGVSSIISPLALSKSTVWKEIPLSLLAAILIAILANDQLIDNDSISALTRIDGIILILFFVIFIYYSYSIAKRIDGMEEYLSAKPYGLIKSISLAILGLIGLILGAKWIVDGAVYLTQMLGVSQLLIGLTIVAIGTSLPELATSVVAAYKKNAEIAVGNVVGSNIFNIFFILGISSTIKPLPFQANRNIDICVMISSNLLLFLCMFTGRRRLLDRWEGIMFVALYAAYIAFLIIQKK